VPNPAVRFAPTDLPRPPLEGRRTTAPTGGGAGRAAASRRLISPSRGWRGSARVARDLGRVPPARTGAGPRAGPELGAWRPQAPRLDRGLQRSREARRHGRAGLTGPGPIRRGQEGAIVATARHHARTASAMFHAGRDIL